MALIRKWNAAAPSTNSGVKRPESPGIPGSALLLLGLFWSMLTELLLGSQGAGLLLKGSTDSLSRKLSLYARRYTMKQVCWISQVSRRWWLM